MCMAHALAILLVVLCAAMGACAGDAFVNVTRIRHMQAHHPHRMPTDEKRFLWLQTQETIVKEGQNGTVECCPSVLEMVAPRGGRTLGGLYVELYVDGENQQQFYELSCAPGVVDKPCRFVDARLHNMSRCVQKYSYSYALVRNPAAAKMPRRNRREGQFSVPGSGGWSLDYVSVRSGCECQIMTPKRLRKRYEKQVREERERREGKGR